MEPAVRLRRGVVAALGSMLLVAGCMPARHALDTTHGRAQSSTASPSPSMTPTGAAEPGSATASSLEPTSTSSASSSSEAPPRSRAGSAPSDSSASADPGVDYADPLAVATAYVTARFSYQAADAAGYVAALTAPQLSTADFTARSVPTADQVAQAQSARDTSAVQVTSTAPSLEAPNDATTQYVTVAFTTTATYTGAPDGGQREDHVWSLRLTSAGEAWLVDAITVGDS